MDSKLEAALREWYAANAHYDRALDASDHPNVLLTQAETRYGKAHDDLTA